MMPAPPPNTPSTKGDAPTGKRTRLSDSVEHIDDGKDTIYLTIPAGQFVLILLAVFFLARCTP